MQQKQDRLGRCLTGNTAQKPSELFSYFQLTGLCLQGEPLESQMQELVGLAHRGNNIMDPHKSWLPLLQCLLKLNSHGQPCSFYVVNSLLTFLFVQSAHFTEFHKLNISFPMF